MDYPIKKPGEPVTRYHVDLVCPGCEGKLTHQADGARPSGLGARAVAACHRCRRHYVITIQIVDATKDVNHQPLGVSGAHGTYSCYSRGCRRPECRAAATRYQSDRRRRLAQAAS